MNSVSIVYITVESVIAVMSIAGNVLVLAAVYINHRLRTVTNQFVASLAVADVMVGAVAIPCAIASYLGHPYGNFDACILVNTIVIVFTQISIFNLLSIAVERYTAINLPFVYERKFTTRNANAIIAITWILAVFLSLVPLMGWNNGRPSVPEVCAFTKVIDMKFMVYFNFFGCVLPPLLVVAAIYVYIFSIVRRQSRIIASLRVGDNETNNNSKRKKFMRDLQAAKSLAIIVFFFALCWMPLHIINTINVLCPTCFTHYYGLLTAIFLSHANSAVNPVIYAFTNKQYKLAFRKMCGLKVPDTWTTTDTIPPAGAVANGPQNVKTISANVT